MLVSIKTTDTYRNAYVVEILPNDGVYNVEKNGLHDGSDLSTMN